MDINSLLGLSSDGLEWYQTSLRAVLNFLLALIFIRIGGIRTLGKQTPFDQMTLLMMGAVLARSIVVGPAYFGSIIAALVLMILHRFIAWATFKNRTAGYFFKGEKILLMKDGIPQNENLQNAHITENDNLEALRRDVHSKTLADISEVYLERSGKLSFIKK